MDSFNEIIEGIRLALFEKTGLFKSYTVILTSKRQEKWFLIKYLMFIIVRILVLGQIYDALDLYFLCYYMDFIVHWDFLYNQCIQYIWAHLYDRT